MRIVLYIILTTALATNIVAAQSALDQLKQKGKEALKSIEETVNAEVNQTQRELTPSTKTERQPHKAKQQPNNANLQTEENLPDDTTSNLVIKSASDLHGRWKGSVKPPGRSYSFDAIGLDIVITPDMGIMRVSKSRCIAELLPTDTLGEFEVNFIDKHKSCGNRALLTFENIESIKVNWIDMPEVDSEKRVYKGPLKKACSPNERSWSVSDDQRNVFDIVGFKLGMKYDDALSYLKSKHTDLENSINILRSEGVVSVVCKLVQKGAKKAGPDVFGEQLTLAFESQTNVEMDGNVQNKIPKASEGSKLRSSRAEAELMFVSRQLQYRANQGPHQDNLIDAMIAKYGKPSIHIKKLDAARGKHKLAWIFDASGSHIINAQGGVCDHISRNASQQEELAGAHTISQRVARSGGVFNPITVSSECGLTIKARLEVDGNGTVWKMSTTVYDQQRLLGDEWYRTVQLSEALIANLKAKAETLKKRNIPDL
jgi:hypothetical protein